MRRAARAGVLASSLTALALAAATPALAAPTPSPSPTPTVTQRVDPAASVGGPRLAQMNTVIVDAPAGVPAPPDTGDLAWLVADADTGEILAAKNPHAYLLPASTMKTLTAVHLLDRIDPSAVLTASTAQTNAEGTRVGMVAGQQYTAAQLFQALIMSSGNDAAYGLAELNGGMDKTVAELQATATELGALDTVVKDPSGLDAPGQRSSAYDLALFGRAAIAEPEYVKISSTRTATFPGVAARASRSARPTYGIGNHNRLLWNYEGTIGVKNGYTRAARRTFIGAARRGGKTYLVTQMYNLGPTNPWRPAAALLDWAFTNADAVQPVGRLVDRGEVTAPPGTTGTAPTLNPTPSPTASAPVMAAAVPAIGRTGARDASGTAVPSLLPLAGGAGVVLLLVGSRLRPAALRRRERGRHRAAGTRRGGAHRT